ncbi:MAG: 3-hydroxyisobutyrate dehydrogenase-like beta-hydroxyacid dehydrogenase [Parasphingorhabdus sp.]|jgi:3-hydroxyisobutyrate dehydrogenase-like beta-hydroxyacid dehydrogenase
MKPTVGFIGLGLMGAAMVEHMQNNGYKLTVMANRSRTAVDAAVGRGAAEVFSAKEVAQNSDIIMLCMDTSASVESRMLGDDGIIAGLSDGNVVIDFGTSMPDSTRELGKSVAAMGAQYLDAPLGRTPAHAREGLLNIMCSGDDAAFQKVKPVLEVLGENVFHLGALGTGHTIKLINNFVGMTAASALAEAFVTAENAGVDPKQLYDVMSSGPLHSGMMDFVAAFALENDATKLEFSIRNARKDVGYYASMLDDLGMPSIMSNGTKQALGIATNTGHGDNKVSQMVSFFREIYKEK